MAAATRLEQDACKLARLILLRRKSGLKTFSELKQQLKDETESVQAEYNDICKSYYAYSRLFRELKQQPKDIVPLSKFREALFRAFPGDSGDGFESAFGPSHVRAFR